MKAELQRIGKNIKFYRNKERLSQAELAKSVGCTVRHIQRIEAGETNLSVLLFIKIAKVLEVDMSLLCLLK